MSSYISVARLLRLKQDINTVSYLGVCSYPQSYMDKMQTYNSFTSSYNVILYFYRIDDEVKSFLYSFTKSNIANQFVINRVIENYPDVYIREQQRLGLKDRQNSLLYKTGIKIDNVNYTVKPVLVFPKITQMDVMQYMKFARFGQKPKSYLSIKLDM